MTVQMADEVRIGLQGQTANQATSMVQTKLEPMLKEEAQAFNKDVRFQTAVGEALTTKRSVQLAAMIVEAEQVPEGGLEAAIKRVEPLQVNVVDLSGMSLGDGGVDVALIIEWMRSNPSGLTRLKMDVPSASGAVVVALHGLVVQTTTLVDLDVMEKGAHTLNMLQLNGTEKVEALDLSEKKLGAVSAAVIAACIPCNYMLKSLK